MKKVSFWITAFFYTVAVFYLASTTPISPHEAKILYTSQDIVSYLMKTGQGISDTFLGLRLFFIGFGFIAIYLFYLLSRLHFSTYEDAYLSTALFMLLPGILTGMTLPNIAIIVLPLVLLFVLIYERGYFWSLPIIMLLLFFIHEASVIFFVALFLYALRVKDRRLGIAAMAFLLAFIYLAKGIVIGGRPSGHFIDIFGLYATVFSPFVFLYFFYAMYRVLLQEKKTLLWYIAFTALAFSLLLSIRQKIHITDFAPYVMIAVLLMLQAYFHSLRVRLPMFQNVYRNAFRFVIATLLLNVVIVVTHQYTYYHFDLQDKHFAKRIYKPYESVKLLKAEGKECVGEAHGREKWQYRYYDMPLCNN